MERRARTTHHDAARCNPKTDRTFVFRCVCCRVDVRTQIVVIQDQAVHALENSSLLNTCGLFSLVVKGNGEVWPGPETTSAVRGAGHFNQTQEHASGLRLRSLSSREKPFARLRCGVCNFFARHMLFLSLLGGSMSGETVIVFLKIKDSVACAHSPAGATHIGHQVKS